MTSCQNGDLTIVRTLLQRKANVRIKDNGGKTPLHLAAKSSKPTQGILCYFCLRFYSIWTLNNCGTYLSILVQYFETEKKSFRDRCNLATQDSLTLSRFKLVF